MSSPPAVKRFPIHYIAKMVVLISAVMTVPLFLVLAMTSASATASPVKLAPAAQSLPATKPLQQPVATFARNAHPQLSALTASVGPPLAPVFAEATLHRTTLAALSHPDFTPKPRTTATAKKPAASVRVVAASTAVASSGPSRAVQVALKLAQDGNHPYRWGAAGPNAFDCSGLIVWSYGKAGISLPHYTLSLVRLGTRIGSLGAARPGDLIFFESTYEHVGLYIGDGNMVVASHSGTNIQIQRVYKTPSAIVRIT